MPITLVMDLDETVLSTRPHLLNSHVVKTVSRYNPYPQGICYTLNKQKLEQAFRNIMSAGGKVAIATASQLDRQKIKNFFQFEFGIEIDDELIFKGLSKNQYLYQIANQYGDLCFVDNAIQHILDARKFGFKVVHADTNRRSSDNNSFIDELVEFSVKWSSAALWRNIGNDYALDDDLISAACAFNEAARISSDAQDWRQAGSFFLKEESFESAAAAFKKAAKISHNPEDWRKAGSLFIKMNYIESAAYAFNEAANITDNLSDWYKARSLFTKVKKSKSANYASRQISRINVHKKSKHTNEYCQYQSPFLSFVRNKNSHDKNESSYQYS
ncbi:hypothetical protein [Piscirickettsia salmonis]|uniref:hypothetical protein n=1 Tax=Piscirickettsia salmonis TaxID=1238 RepID=UPI0007C9487C|nr:hypothetical protein A0O36_02399 [Piscirickettsiaceae bacterium NZ-RLO1]